MEECLMSSHLRRLVLAAAVLTMPSVALSQQGTSSAAKKVTPGLYQVVADPNFSAGMDMSVFTMRIDGDSSLVIEQAGALAARARLWYEGEHMLWSDLEGQLMCPGTAKYKLSIAEDGKSFRLSPVEDPCAERSAIVAQIKMVLKM